jgi:hypothetical protein
MSISRTFHESSRHEDVSLGRFRITANEDVIELNTHPANFPISSRAWPRYPEPARLNPAVAPILGTEEQSISS